MNSFENTLNQLTRKWWFYLLIVIVMFSIPTISQKPYDSRNTSQVIIAVMQNALIYQYPALFPVFKLIPILIITLVFLFGERFTRLFDIYTALLLLFTAIFQNMAFTEQYGFVRLLGNQVVLGLLALLWIWEAIIKRNDFTPKKRPLWKYWVVPVAFLAFWFPIDGTTLQPDFSPLLIFTSEAGLTWCMMVPVILAVLILFEPEINQPLVRLTAFIGLMIAILNILNWFALSNSMWIGILHLPLLVLSIYALVISLKKKADISAIPS